MMEVLLFLVLTIAEPNPPEHAAYESRPPFLRVVTNNNDGVQVLAITISDVVL